ncbi:MAG: HAD-IA family hydrolase [Sphingobium sp.]|nr:HAD-IA family hydrolase [Sphingobium sp.]
MTVRLAIFDCDGTLVDSQHSIVSAMQGAFDAASLTCPDRARILSGVGLSLPQIMAQLLPEADAEFHDVMIGHYKRCFFEMRSAGTLQEPLYDGIADLLDALDAAGWLLAVATGKSDRGLAAVLAHHGLLDRFVSLQTADRHPSKPHPAMIEAALFETGALAGDAVMIGDTSFDMLMANAAGVAALGVSWGYHAEDELFAAGALSVAADSAALANHLGLGSSRKIS